jgi:hypothetical protein
MGPKTDSTAPAISLNLIRTRFLLKTIPREARAIIRRLADCETRSRHSQILALLSIVRDDLDYNWSYREIGTIFNVNKETVHRICSDVIKDIEHDTDRSPILQPDEEADVMAYITDSFQRGSPVSPKQIRAYVADAFGNQVSSSWTWQLAKLHEKALQRATAYLQENIRMEISKEITRTHARNLERYVKDVSTELIFNLDEGGCQEWSDRKTRDAIIPLQKRPCGIEYAASRKEKCVSCITTVLMGGDALILLLVIHRKTIDAAVWEKGWRDGQDFMIRSNNMSYVARPIFTKYVTGVNLPYFAATGESLHLQDFTGVLLCDNCSPHIDESIKQLLADNNIRLVTFTPQTSHLFQPLDFVTFSAFKCEKRKIHVGQPVGSQVWEITKLMRALKCATDSTNNRAAFRRAGLTVNLRIFHPVASIDSRKLNAIIDSSTLPDSFEGDGDR